MPILIVDDSEDMRSLLTAILEGAGHKELKTVSSALEAFECLGMETEDASGDESPFDLILMDIAMPEIDGIEACRRIKSIEILHDIPIIMVSAIDESEFLAFALEAGANDYVTKPFNKIELTARVGASLRLKKEVDIRKAHEKELFRIAKELQKANQKLKLLSTLDGLTGISNRRTFDERMELEWAHARRDDALISLLMIDIDWFKTYNDSHGHLAGDDCLKMVAKAIESNIRRSIDFLARYGGEEFALILPKTKKRGAVQLAENIRMSVEDLDLDNSNAPPGKKLTVSIGVATISPSGESCEDDLIDEADKALYQAKEGGRNKVMAFDDET